MQQAISHSYRRLRSLRTHRITAMPIAILMPHSACNCRCVMCDIWKGNSNRRQLTEDDIRSVLNSLKKLGTTQVVMSGGEALLNENFFTFCKLLRAENIRVTLLSTGLLLRKYANELLENVSDIIVSLDGDENTHDAIRNIAGAYKRLKDGVQYIKSLQPSYRITGRSVIQRLNFRTWTRIIDAAKEIGLDSISFLPADVSSQAFNREKAWDEAQTVNIAIQQDELTDLEEVLNGIILNYLPDFESGFICESPVKLKQIWQYYSAIHGLNDFPERKCNAPWVSVVVEADGSVKPCFFHDTIGNVKQDPLESIINSKNAIAFRKNLDMTANPVCRRCVCSLNLPFYQNPATS